jgi:hypothetical protein
MAVWLEQVLASAWDSVTGAIKIQGIAGAVPIAVGKTVTVSSELTRGSTTTGYTINQTLLNAAGTLTELPGVGRANGGTGLIVGLRLVTNVKSIVPSLRIHFFTASNPTFSADYAAWQDKYADRALRVGFYDMPAMTTAADTSNSDCSRSVDFTARLPFQCAAGSSSLWYAYEVLVGFTPTNGQKIALYASVMQD